MRSIFITLSLPLALVFLSSNFKFCEGRNTTLRTEEDIKAGNDKWIFPTDIPYHYSNSTREIPQHFLPILIDSLPEADGVWVLRYRNFLDLPVDSSNNELKSVITYSDPEFLIKSVKVKVLAFGDVQLDMAFENDENDILDDSNLQKQVAEKITLFGENSSENCTSYFLNKEQEKVLQWVVFQVDCIPARKIMRLEAAIKHPKAFLIIDEIVINFENVCTGSRDGKNSLAMCLNEDYSIGNKITNCTMVK